MQMLERHLSHRAASSSRPSPAARMLRTHSRPGAAPSQGAGAAPRGAPEHAAPEHNSAAADVAAAAAGTPVLLTDFQQPFEEELGLICDLQGLALTAAPGGCGAVATVPQSGVGLRGTGCASAQMVYM